jgi:hypothetical protein
MRKIVRALLDHGVDSISTLALAIEVEATALSTRADVNIQDGVDQTYGIPQAGD